MEIGDFLRSGIDDLELHWNESTFGLTELSPAIEERGRRARKLACLEIGSGVGLLLARLQDRYPDHTWQGVDPIGPGFVGAGAPLDPIAAKYDLTVHRRSFEDFEPTEAFDFIFSVNALEHVPSWRDCIAKAHALLRPGGAAVFLCPNYSFPYEPHYALPIVLTKGITARVFRRRIARYDREQQTAGLWSSLNFIKKRDVVAFCRERAIPLAFDEAVMTRMIEKHTTDVSFATRQRALARPAKLLHRLGVTRLLERFPHNRLSPYAKINIQKP